MKRLALIAALCVLCVSIAYAEDAGELTYYFHIDGAEAGREYVLIVASGERETLNLSDNGTLYYVTQKRAGGSSLSFTVVRPAAFDTATAFVVSDTGAVVKRFVLNRSGETVVLPAALSILGNKAFADSGVTHVIVPEGCVSIGAEAFAGHAGPLVLELPESVTDIGEGALKNCPYALIVAPAGSYAVEWARENGVVYASP